MRMALGGAYTRYPPGPDSAHGVNTRRSRSRVKEAIEVHEIGFGDAMEERLSVAIQTIGKRFKLIIRRTPCGPPGQSGLMSDGNKPLADT